ncbi:hypothetical protein [Microbulbifer aestuariivivens]|uniref:hypothetical protein n=1 Tax=Microbulbifer aestuariivivens TaxID=1908308 RepID=UPI0031E93BEA
MAFILEYAERGYNPRVSGETSQYIKEFFGQRWDDESAYTLASTNDEDALSLAQVTGGVTSSGGQDPAEQNNLPEIFTDKKFKLRLDLALSYVGSAVGMTKSGTRRIRH